MLAKNRTKRNNDKSQRETTATRRAFSNSVQPHGDLTAF
jgi:hypothetical protein